LRRDIKSKIKKFEDIKRRMKWERSDRLMIEGEENTSGKK